MNIVVSLLIIVALLYVLKVYVDARHVVRSRLLNALIIFTVIFIAQNLFALHFFFEIADDYSAEMASRLLVLNLLGLMGFTVFAYAARQ